MVCAFLPLFTMAGPEGRIFGPMADTYAFALAGALLLAMTLSPVLCSLLLHRLKPKPDNLLVRWMQPSYLRELQWCLRHRWITLAVFARRGGGDRGRRCRCWAGSSCRSSTKGTSGSKPRFP